MKHRIILALLTLTVTSWAQTATQTDPASPEKAKCACCEKMAASEANGAMQCGMHHDAQAGDMEDMACCAGKEKASCPAAKDDKSCMKGEKANACADRCGKDKAAGCCGEKCGKDAGKGCCASEKKAEGAA